MEGALRIGVLLDETRVPAWAARVLHTLQMDDGFELAFVGLPETPPKRATTSILRPGRLLFERYVALDERLLRTAQDAFVPVELDEKLSATATLRITPLRDQGGPRLAAADADAIRARDLDVLLMLGMRGLGGLGGLARHGVWAFREDWFHEAPFVRAVLRSEPVTETSVCRVGAEGEPGAIIYRSHSATRRSSVHLNRNGSYWKGSELLVRCLRELAARGRVPPATGASAESDPGSDASLHRAPGGFRVLLFLASLAARLVRNRMVEFLFDDDWCIAVRRRAAAVDSWRDLSGFQVLPWPADCYYSDPFVFREKDRTFVFAEKYDKPRQKGVIAAIELDADGRVTSEPRVVLERDYHLSYPFVFHWNDGSFMIPESGSNRTIELYRAVCFPEKWELERVLFDGVNAVDSTLLVHDDRFWLFTCMLPDELPGSQELHVFHARSPLGPWTAHARNPVVSDVRSARPAGRLFRRGDDWIRPAQDCSARYGWSIQLQRVERLTPTEYREAAFDRIEPGRVPRRGTCTHTWNREGDVEAIDGRVLRWRWR